MGRFFELPREEKERDEDSSLVEMIQHICEVSSISTLSLVEYQLRYPNDECNDSHLRRFEVRPGELQSLIREHEIRREELYEEFMLIPEEKRYGRTEDEGFNYCLGLTSEVILSSREKLELFFLDFRGKEIERVREVITLWDITPGFIVDSGASYHFYSSRLFSKKETQGLLRRFDYPEDFESEDSEDVFLRKIKLENYVDGLWTRTQLENGYSTLRISRGITYKTQRPVVIEEIKCP